MNEENLNINELIELKQMPVIFYQLEEIGKLIDTQLEGIENMAVTEENKQEVKKRRAEINNLNTVMENKRKEIKKKILEDYEIFNDKYETEIKNKLQSASITLKEKIDTIEKQQLEEKNNNLIDFFNEYVENYHLKGLVSYENLNINVILSASEKSLKEQIKGKLESIANDVALINLEEFNDEIMYEYKNNGFNFAGAKLLVVDRHHKMLEMENARKELESKKAEEKIVEEAVEEITKPVEIEEVINEEELINENQMMIYTFTVTGTKEDIISVRDFMKERGISYE